ncbi:sugar phosphate isomerase/epimerase family protein [Paenarthrobacter nicotinovorans]|uniref:sugar phosphate isomerase/epimerase family protein n=1 Tax=Paenarthrobacter nicotinovorans TaxID=29320 RepID=UPI0038099017
MTLSRAQFALNAIQWINIKEDPNDPTSADLWLYGEPSFVEDYPSVLKQIKAAGFDAVMMEVLATQTLQNYANMVEDAELRLAPGYAMAKLPSDYLLEVKRGSREWAHWFDGVRRKAEETNYFGLSTIFLAPEMGWQPTMNRVNKAAAVGADFDQERLNNVVEMLTEACEIFRSEGIRPGLHNHVGTWVETRQEIDYVMENIDNSLLGASFDIGHLEWAGIDSVEMLGKYSDRIVDLHFKDLNLDVAKASRENPTDYSTTSNRGLFAEPGLGQVNLDAVLGALPAQFPGWIIIEVDRATMDPYQSALHTADWLRENIPA